MARTLDVLKEVVPEPVNQVLDDIAVLGNTSEQSFAGEITIAGLVNANAGIEMAALAADPATPAAGRGVLWMSDGTGTGSEGDLIFKWRDAGDTTTTTETITKV